MKSFGIVESVRMIFFGYGLVWKRDLFRIFEYYECVGVGVFEKDKVFVIYDFMYGFVERRMEIVFDELRKYGKKFVVYCFMDKEVLVVSDIFGEVLSVEVLIIGVLIYEVEIYLRICYVFYEIVDKVNYEKFVFIVGVFGWGGVVGRKIEMMIIRSKFDYVVIVESKGYLMLEDEEKLREVVRKFV